MDRHARAASWLVLSLAIPALVLAQQTTTTSSLSSSSTTSPTSTSRPSSTRTYSNGTSTSTSTSTGTPSSHQNSDPGINYQYIFLIAIAIVAFGGTTLGVCLRHRRRRDRALTMSRGAEEGLQRDLSRRAVLDRRTGGDGARQRQWYGRGGRRWYWSGDAEANEGLNEHGEAPPPYRRRRASGESRRSGRQSREDLDGASVVPLSVLDPASGGGAAVKPPDYVPAAAVVEVARDARSSMESSANPVVRPPAREDDDAEAWRLRER